MSKNTWSGIAADWKQRFEVGDVVADPAGDWDPTTAQAYIDAQIATVTSDLASETLARQTADNQIKGGSSKSIATLDSESVKVVTQNLTTAQKDIANSNLQNKDTSNGMARIILKATDNFKNVIEAQTGGNTIFVIRYDYTLTGNVNIPSNCILEFDGGSISAGSGSNMNTVNGNNTGISAGLVKVFNTNVTLAGSWNVSEAYPEWFGAKGNGSNDVIPIQKSVFFHKIIFSKNYYVEGTISVGSNTELIGHNSSSLYCDAPNNFFSIIEESENVIIRNLNLIGVGEGYPTYTMSTAHAAYIVKIYDNCKNISINGCLLKGGTGGIFITEGANNIDIEYNIFEDMLELLDDNTNPTSVVGGYGVVLNRYYNDGTEPSRVEDITNNIIVSNNRFNSIQRHCFYPQVARNVYFENNVITNSIINAIGTEHAISDCGVENIFIKGNTMDCGLSFYQYYNYNFSLITPKIYIEGNNINTDSFCIRFHNEVENVKIIDNIFTSSQYGIYTNGKLKNVSIHNNTFTIGNFTSMASSIGFAQTAILQNANITGNNIKGTNNTGFGILLGYINSIDNVIIANNSISDINRGIDIGDISSTLDKVYIYSNIITNSASSSIRCYEPNKCTNLIVRNNLVNLSVSLSSDSTRNIVSDNNYIIV